MDGGDGHRGGAFILRLGDDQMRMAQGGDLRKVRDAEDLVGGAEGGELAADLRADFSAHVGIDFIEDQHGRLVDRREDRLQREHHAGGFAAGGDLVERQQVLAGVRTEKETDGIGTLGT
jgi:hypothetical protein